MNRSTPTHPAEALLAVLVCAASLQFVNAFAWSLGGGLAYSWIGSAFIGLAAVFVFVRKWNDSDPSARREFIGPWRWPPPWIFLAVMLWQIAFYPPMMNDSLCYRLPRIFLWLQEGGIHRTGASDGRILEMPYGWEILALPLVALNQVTFAAIINLLAWIAALHLFHQWILNAGGTKIQARRLSLALATAPVFLLQATSTANDLFAATLLMVSFHFLHSFNRSPHWPKIFLSLVAFMMACGMKPQFLVLGAGWGCWWLFDPSKPWKHTKALPLAGFGAIALLVSPLPVFVSNYLASGSVFGLGLDSSMVAGSLVQKTGVSTAQFLSAQLQLPLMPGAEQLGGFIRSLVPFQSTVPGGLAFESGIMMIPIIDWASFGLIHFSLIVLGVLLALGTCESRHRWLLGFAILGFLIAGSRVVPSTIGRSFSGFVAILIPLAIPGILSLGVKWQRAICVVAVLAGFVVMILNPSSPAWPSRYAEKYAKQSGRAGIAEKLGRYHAYQERAQTGVGFLTPVPAGEKVALLVRGYTPLVGLWTPDWKRNRIAFVHEIPPEKFQALGHEWLLVGDNAAETYPEQVAAYKALPGWELVSEKAFRPTITSGFETWTLYHLVPSMEQVIPSKP